MQKERLLKGLKKSVLYIAIGVNMILFALTVPTWIVCLIFLSLLLPLLKDEYEERKETTDD